MKPVKVTRNKALTNKEFINIPIKVTRNNGDFQTKWLKVWVESPEAKVARK